MDWQALKKSCAGCCQCALSETRTNVVFGDGNENAEVMFIGEGPGESEDLQGIPFVGRAGKLLDDMLSLIDLDRLKRRLDDVVFRPGSAAAQVRFFAAKE